MKPDELRALADALEPMAAAPCFDGIDIAAAADYLRAQADAQPVEWRVDARYAGERRWSPYLHCRSQHEAEQMATIAAQANVETRIVPLYVAPVPQVAAGSGEQREPTEPKRGPTCLWSRADEDTDTWETACRHAFTIIEGTPTDNQMAFCCYCGRPVEQEIGGSDAE